jgi:proteasome accessory factor A
MRGVRTRVLSRTGTELFRLTNFPKRAMAPAGLQFRNLPSLFAQRQRLQIGFSDANACENAEYLKIGTAMLVIDMAEAGWLRHAPRLTNPMAAMRAIGSGDGLRATVRTTRGPLTGVQIQRWYAERATAFLAAMPAVPMEAPDLIRRWRTVLDALDSDPDELVGRVDWVTKRYLLDTVASDASIAERKKVDMRYHELATGYAAQLAAEGLLPRVTDDESVARAMHEPPEDTPAAQRSRFVRKVADESIEAHIDWRQVRVKLSRFRGKVVRLDDYR